MNTWKPNPKIEIEFNRPSVFYPYSIRVRGVWAGQPFTGRVYRRDSFGYHVELDKNINVFCPENRWRLAQIVAPAYAGNGYNIEFVSKDQIETY